MRNLPTFKQLTHLVSLFEHKHFGQAAEACFVSQSTMSASIAQLEAILEAQLLERDHKTFIFTPLGEKVSLRARDLLRDCQELIDHAKTQAKPMQGELRLGCIPTIAPFIIAPLIAQIKEDYPDLKCLIREDTTDHLLHLLEQGDIDLVILALPYETNNLDVKTIHEDPFHLVVPHAWQERIQGQDLDFWPDESIFLLAKEHCLTKHSLQACHLKNTKKINPFFATSLYSLIQMVNAGLGLSFLPEVAIKNGILNGTDLVTLPLPNGPAYREIGMAWRSSSFKKDTYLLLADLAKVILNSGSNLT